jgi:hypothetical protein
LIVEKERKRIKQPVLPPDLNGIILPCRYSYLTPSQDLNPGLNGLEKEKKRAQK